MKGIQKVLIIAFFSYITFFNIAFFFLHSTQKEKKINVAERTEEQQRLLYYTTISVTI